MILHQEIGEIVGRDALLEDIYREIKKEKHILLTGRVGVGKTTLLEALSDAYRTKGAKCILVQQTNPMKPALETLVE